MNIRSILHAHEQDLKRNERRRIIRAVLWGTIGGLLAAFAALALASAAHAGPDDDARAALALAQANAAKPTPKKEEPKVEQPKPSPASVDDGNFATAYYKALDAGKPLVIFVGIQVRGIPGAVCLQMDSLNGKGAQRIVVARSGLKVTHNLEADASDDAIMLAAFPRNEVSPPATPFAKPSSRMLRGGGLRARPDDDLAGYGPWPKGLEKVSGLKRYAPATMTQETFNKGIIRAVPIANLEDKYHQSGGMLGVSGWRSDLYKFVPAKIEHRRAWVPVFNGSNNQDEQAFVRNYPDGTVFFDVLSKDGQVFEARKAEKKNGSFRRSVVFRDEKHYPEGYAGLKMTCASCHDEAGSGGYAVGLAPGGDTVLSDPIPQLEAGYRDPF